VPAFHRRHFSLRLLLTLGFAVLLLGAVVISGTQTRPRRPGAFYRHGSLYITLPYHSTREGSGRLIAEILDPEDHVLSKLARTVRIGKGDGAWQQTITPEKPISFEDMIWHRVRFRFTYDGEKTAAFEGVESISQILRRPVVHILGQTEYLAGSEAAVRVVVSDATNHDHAEAGTVRIELLVPGKKSVPLFAGELNRRGTVEPHFCFPAGLTGKYEMRYVADTPVGSTEYTQPIALRDTMSILLTTDKPIYQPGQTIHVRALAFNRADHRAEASRKLTFEIEDSRDNKVFKKPTATDKFGIASAEFSLADEVNLGTYHLRALMGEETSPSDTAEIALNVERYVLPKFKVAVEFDKNYNKPKRDYRPGDHVTGTVRANYFFGKPVDNAGVIIKASGIDVTAFEAASVKGTTDNDGVYHFDLKLPAYFAGHPLSQGAARVLVEATVKDSANHSETRGEPVTISESAILITAVPEGGALVPHIENEVFILSSYADGAPASASLTVHLPKRREQMVATDDGGVALVRVNPDDLQSLRVDADDHRGNRTSADIPLQTRDGADQVLLRTHRAVLKAGDPIQIEIFSTRDRGPAYVDIVRNGQTIISRDLDLSKGHADLVLTATPEMAGTLDINAYVFGRNAQPVADHRLVFVQPAEELKIEAAADKAEYKPGSEARLRFHITNSRGEGVSAALGLQVVDEAVFALAEKQPGFAKVFFYLEQEAMKPRYEIHSLSLSSVVEPTDITRNSQQDRAARALFAATEMSMPARLDTEFGRSLPQEKYTQYQERYRSAFVEKVRQIAVKLSVDFKKVRRNEDFTRAFANVTLDNGSRPRDSWNGSFRIEPVGSRTGSRTMYRVRSAGPDHQFETADDLALYIEDGPGGMVSQSGNGGALDVKVEHGRGPFNGRAEVTGTVIDPSGAAIANAVITLRQLSTQNTRTTHANDAGQFTFTGLPVGGYKAEIVSPGFEGLSGEFVLAARDRALLCGTLTVGGVSETVMVKAEAMPTIRVDERSDVSMNGRRMMAAEAKLEARDAVATGSLSFAAVANTAPVPFPAAHLRSYFPEALYINPEILTDANGNASISIPIADSITTWRIAMLASTASGALGTSASSIKVFQDFFVDLDLPLTLTQGDRVSIPVALHNYSGGSGRVSVKLQLEDWFSLDDSSSKTIDVETGRTGAAQFTINARRNGTFKLTVSARMDGARGETREDIVVRAIEVIPNGREQNLVFNGRLEGSVREDLRFPSGSIPDASSILIRLYPGPLSQVIEGMDSILTMPGGCFEQTSSSTYPNVLALDYLKRTKKLTPEVHAKAEGYIANGYQRLLTFEVPGGGFSWFGQAPSNKILTAYGLMEFNDMSKVSDVDLRLIHRTGEWLVAQQQPDGSWKPDTSFINEGATDRYNSDVLRITAYIAWALVNTGYQGPAVEKAKQFIENGSRLKADAYTLAILANFAADYGKDRDFTRQSMQSLLDTRTEKDDMAFWTVEETGVYSTGVSAAIETTGLATQALLKWGQASASVRKALNFISSKKEASGNWGTTQATITALRALLLASQAGGSNVHGSVRVLLNGEPLKNLKLTAENNDLLHQFVFKGVDPHKPTSVQLIFDGDGGVAYQIVGRYFIPWEDRSASEPLSIDVSYDRTTLARNDIATATATIRNNLPKTANMVMVDLGIPPGFDLLSEDLQSFQEKTAGAETGKLEKFTLTATQAILYFNGLSPKQIVNLEFRLRAKFPIRANGFQSRVYAYYDPDVNATARPVRFEVRDK
jgi:hypothetical protein